MNLTKILTAVIIAGVGSLIIPAISSGFLSKLNETYPDGNEYRWIYTLASLAPVLAIAAMWIGVIIYAVNTFRNA